MLKERSPQKMLRCGEERRETDIGMGMALTGLSPGESWVMFVVNKMELPYLQKCLLLICSQLLVRKLCHAWGGHGKSAYVFSFQDGGKRKYELL